VARMARFEGMAWMTRCSKCSLRPLEISDQIIGAICRLAGIDSRSSMTSLIRPEAKSSMPLPISANVHALCELQMKRLDLACQGSEMFNLGRR
jgi:hypothetical protein